MNGGKILGRGSKGQVMDYGSEDDPLSFEHTVFPQVDHVILHVVDKDKIKQVRQGPSVLSDLQQKDTSCTYVVKEFTPKLLPSVQGLTPHESMMDEIHAIQYLLPLIHQRNLVGMMYEGSLLIGVEIFMKSTSRYFMIQHKCQPVRPMTTEASFISFAQQILSEVVLLQKVNLAHNDIKLSNIMMYKGKYELIDWECATPLEYSFLEKKTFIQKHPIYYRMRFGSAWKPAFYTAMLLYDKHTLPQYYEYVNAVVAHYEPLLRTHTKEVFEQCKYEIDLFLVGLTLYMMIQRPLLKKYKPFVMNLFKMKNAKEALRHFNQAYTKKYKKTIKKRERS